MPLRILTATLIALVTATTIAMLATDRSPYDAPGSEERAEQVPALPPPPIGQEISIELPLAEFVLELSPEERREQMRDWAVLAIVAQLSATPEQAAAATYELPPARLPEFEELYQFEQGRGRRAYLNDRVLLFVDRDDPDRQTTLGRLADRVRMESGTLAGEVEVYEVIDRVDDGALSVVRVPSIAQAALFSSEYGYVEGEATTEQQLARWLAEADDLTSVEMAPDGRIKLGGRRFAGTRTPNLTLEDVAAIYQAHDEVGKDYQLAKSELVRLPEWTQNTSRTYARHVLEGTLTPEIERTQRARLMEVTDFDSVDSFLYAAVLEARGPPAPGFSLDPEWLPSPTNSERLRLADSVDRLNEDLCGEIRAIARLADELEKKEPDPTRRSARTARALDVKRVAAYLANLPRSECALIQLAARPLLQPLERELSAATTSDHASAIKAFYERIQSSRDAPLEDVELLVLPALHFYREDSRAQCARYEGFKGTSVGMTLFYTDLLAKLWLATDYGHSAPTIELPGFLSSPLLEASPVLDREQDARRSSTRIWFGPRPESVSRSDNAGKAVFSFDHRFHRIYAAGSNPARPDQESTPEQEQRRAVRWWNQHFEEISDYEPQYHHLNQIMKWSLVTGALLEAKTSLFGAANPSARDEKFSTWVRANASHLRFSEDLPDAHASLPDRECIPIIASYDFQRNGHPSWISGGVSTSSRAAAREVPSLTPSNALGLRKSALGNLGEGTAGTAQRVAPSLSKLRVSFTGPSKASRGWPDIAARGSAPRTAYAAGKSPRGLTITSGGVDGDVGALHISPAPARVHLDWKRVAGARAPSSPSAPSLPSADRLAAEGHLVPAAKLYEPHLTVRPTTPDELARTTMHDLASGNARGAIEHLHSLENLRPWLSPDVNEGLTRALAKHSDDLASALKAKRALPRLVTDRGRIATERDLGSSVLHSARTIDPSDLSNAIVYRDTRLVLAREGTLPGKGGSAPRWRKPRNVRVEELRASQLGELPDRFQLPDGSTLVREPRRSSIPPMAAASISVVFLVRPCDADQKTPSRRDDC